MGATAFPLLYVGTSLAMALFSLPLGHLADRVGRRRMVIAGYVLLAGVYGLLLTIQAGGWLLLAAVIAMLGAFYAATDGVLTAMAAAVLPKTHSGSGLAVLSTATNVARLTASVVFGWLWTTAGLGPATAVALAALGVAILIASRVLARADQHATPTARRVPLQTVG
jgi:MFS family permease